MKAEDLPRPISGIALRLAGDTWAPWMPAEFHSLYRGFKELQLRSFEVAYDAQQKLLDKENAKDIFVGPFIFARRPDGSDDQRNCMAGRLRSDVAQSRGDRV